MFFAVCVLLLLVAPVGLLAVGFLLKTHVRRRPRFMAMPTDADTPP